MGAVTAAIISVACSQRPVDTLATEPTASPLPVTAEIRCNADGSTTLVTPEVATRADGVHVEIDNRSDEVATIGSLVIADAILDVDPGESRYVVDPAPGPVNVACFPGSLHDGPAPDDVTMTVRDVEDHWVDPALECVPGSIEASRISDYLSGSTGDRREPEVVVRERMDGVREDDHVERAGYSEADVVYVRIVRDGRTVGNARLSRQAGGGWLLHHERMCHDRSG